MEHRTIVTERREDGRSRIAHDGPAAEVVEPAPGLVLAEHWRCLTTAGDLLDAPNEAPAGFEPVPGPAGVLFRTVTFPPDPVGQMHRTDTVDFVTVISGELVLALEGGEETTLRAGDVVVQRGAAHAWRNPTSAPAVVTVVMMDGARSA